MSAKNNISVAASNLDTCTCTIRSCGVEKLKVPPAEKLKVPSAEKVKVVSAEKKKVAFAKKLKVASAKKVPSSGR